MARPTGEILAGIVLLLASACAVNAGWRDEASAPDIARLQQLDAARMRALAQAQAAPGQGDARAIAATLSMPGRAVAAGALAGTWRCRQIKLGGISSYVVFGWFHCRISRAANGEFRFEKLDGTQRTSGTLSPDNGAFVYLGASHVKGEQVHAYSGRGQSLGAEATPDDQIGLLSAIGPHHLRLEIPSASPESDFDVIELKR